VPLAPGRARLQIDFCIAGVLVLASAVWATRYWNEWVGRGGQPVFYQTYFEPAVMIACGHGFVVASPARPAALTDFLQQRRDTFSCDEIPASLTLGQQGMLQRSWRYLMYLVGFAWRVLGISWHGMGPLFGLLFGVSVALVYGISRLGMGRALALLCAFGVSISTVHLLNLPHLRDFAKEPFTLALVFILGLLVTVRASFRSIVGLAAAYGAVLGVAYGFRADFLIDIPLFVLTLALFVDDGPLRNLKVKLAGMAAFAAAFAVVGWPILSTVYQKGGCQWHVVLLGLQSPFDGSLAVQPAPYDFGYAYADDYIYATVAGFAGRTSPQRPQLGYCSHEYDVESGRYLKGLVEEFPADFMTRSLASSRVLAELPFLWFMPPMLNWASSLYGLRAQWLAPLRGLGIWIVGLALLIAGAGRLRLGLFLLFFSVFVTGYPAIQFHDRHYFHLEFMTWWACGFTIQQLAATVWRTYRTKGVHLPSVFAGGRRMAVLALCAWLLLALPLKALRAYQGARVTRLLGSYVSASKARLDAPAGQSGAFTIPAPPIERFGAEFIEVDLEQARCAGPAKVTFRYDPAVPAYDFTHTVALDRSSPPAGLTRVFLSVYQHFTGIEFSGADAGCVAGAYRLTDPRAFPLLVDATLAPGWESRPLYQRLARWIPR